MKDETVKRFTEIDEEDAAADKYSREDSNEGTPIFVMLRMRRAFLAGVRWRKEQESREQEAEIRN